MRRLYYFGDDEADPRLAGVRLYPGVAVDVPGDLAISLMEQQEWNDEPKARVMPTEPDLANLLDPKKPSRRRRKPIAEETDEL